ncbi:MAG: type IV secretory system conjugative DNA transfer family protein [Planctomycetes bacterium]|nr:type IV secretory system conjugative DNA transfer family protein [Planctomycetota bacterium]
MGTQDAATNEDGASAVATGPASVHRVATAEGSVSLAGFRLTRMLSAELFREVAADPGPAGGDRHHVVAACLDRWTDLAAAWAQVPRPIEALLVIASEPSPGPSAAAAMRVLAVGRGADAARADDAAREAAGDLGRLLATYLDYAELSPIEDPDELERAARAARAAHVVEVRRRIEDVQASHGGRLGPAVGYGRPPTEPGDGGPPARVRHLFPWVPGDDAWRGLWTAVAEEPGGAAFVVHARGCERAPAEAAEAARRALADAERVRAFDVPDHVRTVFSEQARVLTEEAAARLALLEGPVLAARAFLATAAPPSGSLVAVVRGATDDASARVTSGQVPWFRGGAVVRAVAAAETIAPLDDADVATLFGPAEAPSLVRTPTPSSFDLPGLPAERARTAPPAGAPGGDVTLGTHRHRGRRVAVRLDREARARHTYVVGQTGTGKSTLLLRMVLDDLERGHGVAVLDPHGSLVEQVLERMPAARRDGVVVLDATDVERPVGLNPLRLEERDPLAYRLARDLVIDDLYAYLDRTYDLRLTGGPIFETQLRAMLALLMGAGPQDPPLVPNLMVFRSLFANPGLREALARRAEAAGDPSVREFVLEAEAAKGDAALSNLAPYVTSKFNRFLADLTLRNMTCQATSLDLGDLVARDGVLLVNLGKGRFGDQAAGLLAATIVSRVRRLVMARGARGWTTPFHLYADEFQLFADARFSEILAEARKFGLTLTVAHQYLQQLRPEVLDAVLGNVGTVVALRVGAQDAERLEPLFAPTFRARDLSSLGNYRAYVRTFGRLGATPFSLDVDPAPPATDPGAAHEVREASRLRHGRDRTDVERDIAATHAAFAALRAPPRA